MAEGLRLVVGADVEQAAQALNQFVNKLNSAASSAETAGARIENAFGAPLVSSLQKHNKLFADMQRNFANLKIDPISIPIDTSKFDKAKTSIKELDLSVETLRAKILAKREFIVTERDISKIIKLNKEIESLESTLNQVQNAGKDGFWGGAPLDNLGRRSNMAASALSKLPKSSNAATLSLLNLGRVAQDAPFGMLGIANNINPLLESFQRLRAQSTSTGGALKSLAGSLIGGGGLGLAVSVVTGLMSFFALRSRSAKEETEKQNVVVEEAKKKQQELAQAFDKAAGSIVSQAKDIQNLRDILLSTTSAASDLTQATVNLGVARFIFDEKNVTLQKALNAQIEREVLLRKKSGRQGVLGAPELSVDRAIEAIRLFEQTEAKARGLVFIPSAELKRLDELHIILGESSGELRGLNALAGDLGNFFKSFLDGASGADKAVDKAGETTEQFIERAKKLSEELRKIGFLQPEFSFFDSIEVQLTKARKIFDDFNARRFRLDPNFFKLEGGFNVPPAEVERALNQVEEGIQKGIISRGGFTVFAPVSITTNLSQNAQLIDEFKDVFKSIGLAIPDIDIDLTAGFNRNVFVQELRDFFKAGEEASEAGLRSLAATFASGIANVNKSIETLKIEALSGIGEAVGQALAGADFNNVFKGFISALASSIQAIGKQFIAMGIMAKLATKALAKLFTNPLATIGVGIGLIAISAALRQTMNKGVTGFAQGGLVFGPTMGLVGEGVGTSRSNPEVIAPLDQLKGMLSEFVGGGQSNGRLTGRLRGKDLILQTARTGRSQSRLGSGRGLR